MPLARLSAANGRPWRKLQSRQTTTPTDGKDREAVLAALLSRNQPPWLQCWLRTVGRGPLPALAGRKLGAGYRARTSNASSGELCTFRRVASSATVGASNSTRIRSSTPNAFRIWLTNLVASNECPPNAKKLFFRSARLTIPLPSFLKRRGKSFAVNLSVGCERPCSHGNNSRRQHVLGNPLPQVLNYLGCESRVLQRECG